MKLNIFLQKGQGQVEFALLLALIAIVVIIALFVLGPEIADIYGEVVARLDHHLCLDGPPCPPPCGKPPCGGYNKP